MKSIITALLVSFFLLTLANSAVAYPKKGDKEVSASAAFSAKRPEMGGNWQEFTIASRLGIFLTDQFELEPELALAASSGMASRIVLSGNLIYNIVPDDPERDAVPFLLGGLGFSNAPSFGLQYGYRSWHSPQDVWIVINGGAGVKTFITSTVALRLEYRYQRFSGDSDLTQHSVLFGVSAFL